MRICLFCSPSPFERSISSLCLHDLGLRTAPTPVTEEKKIATEDCNGSYPAQEVYVRYIYAKIQGIRPLTPKMHGLICLYTLRFLQVLQHFLSEIYLCRISYPILRWEKSIPSSSSSSFLCRCHLHLLSLPPITLPYWKEYLLGGKGGKREVGMEMEKGKRRKRRKRDQGVKETARDQGRKKATKNQRRVHNSPHKNKKRQMPF